MHYLPVDDVIGRLLAVRLAVGGGRARAGPPARARRLSAVVADGHGGAAGGWRGGRRARAPLLGDDRARRSARRPAHADHLRARIRVLARRCVLPLSNEKILFSLSGMFSLKKHHLASEKRNNKI